MFSSLSERLNGIFTELRRRGKLSEADVDSVMREVRLALLEADVHYSVVKDFVSRVRQRAVGHEVSRALNPAQQVIKIVHEEVIITLGEPSPLNLSGPKPRIFLLVGLQGSGKTTASAKIARLLRSQGERVMLVAADPYRPAAIKQLQTLGEQIGVEVFTKPDVTPPDLISQANESAAKGGFSVVIADTAGRSQLDQPLMDEISEIHQRVNVAETLLVVDAMIGQEALQVAEGFREVVPLTGLMLTKMDGDARGGAAISIRTVTGVPIKFLGTGEGNDAIETFDPNRLSSRILGMGDIIGLIEKAEIVFDQEQAQEQATKMLSGEFTLEDFTQQLKQLRKMGPLQQVLDMLPGRLGSAANVLPEGVAEEQLKKAEAIINSMTVKERKEPSVLNASRRRRIAKGSGTDVQDVNKIMKQFREAQRMFKMIKKSGTRDISRLFR